MNNKDKFQVLTETGERQLTLQKICDIIGIPVPETFDAVKEQVENHVSARLKDVQEGCIHFIISDIESDTDLVKRLERLRKKNCIAVFAEKYECERVNLDCDAYSVIPVENVAEKGAAFFSYMKELNPAKTVAVTGTCGKTTTMKFLNHIVPEVFNTFMNKGNANSYMSVANHIMTQLKPEHEVYIQEVGAANLNSVKKAAQMLKVDAFILLNVFNHHSNIYGSPEGILKDKVSLDDYMKDGGTVIVNYDDERLSVYPFKHDVVTFGIETEADVDYRASNIRQNGPYLDLDITYEGKTVHITVNILGTHNAYNVLAAFAMSRWLGVEEADIVAGFARYKSLGFRQNYRNVAGYNLLLDCYNVCEDSLKADLKTMKELDVEEGKKKIAVITGENKLGENAYQISYDLGRSLDLQWMDHIIVVGTPEETQENIDYYCHGRAVYEGIQATGYKNVVYVTNTKDMEAEIRKVIREGDLILFKGMYNMDLIPVIDRVFSTDLAMNNPYYIKQAKLVKHKNFKALKFPVLDSLDIVAARPKMKKLCIPDAIDDIPVYRVKPNLCKNDQYLKKISFGKSIVNIGDNAFAGCTHLKKIVIPGNVKVIEEGAFRGCTKLKKVIIEEGVTHIDAKAFAECPALKQVVLPNSLKYIDPTAFEN